MYTRERTRLLECSLGALLPVCPFCSHADIDVYNSLVRRDVPVVNGVLLPNILSEVLRVSRQLYANYIRPMPSKVQKVSFHCCPPPLTPFAFLARFFCTEAGALDPGAIFDLLHTRPRVVFSFWCIKSLNLINLQRTGVAPFP